MVESTRTRIHASEYYQLPEYAEHDLIQLIEGEVIVGMPPRTKHQDIVRELLIFLGLYARKSGGKAYDSPIELYLDEQNIYEPDVLYLKPNSRCAVEEKRLVGPPELIVEVLSPSTAKYDRQQKFRAYERHAVEEYWIVDALHNLIEVFVLTDSKFQLQGAYSPDDTFVSLVLGESVNVKLFFAE